jgi:hypothetical protein
MAIKQLDFRIYKIKMEKFICPKCNFEIKTRRNQHFLSCNGKGPRRKWMGKKYPGKSGGWNKGLNLSLDQVEKMKKSLTGKKLSDETKKKLSNKAKDRGLGGKTKGGGRGKSGWYKGYWCDSSWELAYVIYNIENNIEFERNKEGFEYIFENQKLKYYPDFKKGDQYIEIKGWMDEKNKAKIEQFKGDLKILFRSDLKEIFNYVESKYGKDFVKLYGG